jgi:membrane protein YqaA with SNARE-associated domain
MAENKKFFLIRWMKSMKDWIESFAEKPSAMWVLFILAFAESSFFPIPPDVLLIAIAVSAPSKALKAALYCSLGSVLGGVLGYYIGFGLMEQVGNPLVELYNYQDKWAAFMDSYNEYGPWFLAAASFTPIPYKISTIASGAAQMDLFVFIVVSSVGRAARFFLVGGLIKMFGAKMKEMIDKYFDVLSIAFIILLVGGFVAVKYLF